MTFRKPFIVMGLRPGIPELREGRSPVFEAFVAEGHRPSAHQAAEPRLRDSFRSFLLLVWTEKPPENRHLSVVY
jgi:hypothetical protein